MTNKDAFALVIAMLAVGFWLGGWIGLAVALLLAWFIRVD